MKIRTEMPCLLSHKPKNHSFPKAQQFHLEIAPGDDYFWGLTSFSWNAHSRPHGHSFLEFCNSLAQEIMFAAEERAHSTHVWLRINRNETLAHLQWSKIFHWLQYRQHHPKNCFSSELHKAISWHDKKTFQVKFCQDRWAVLVTDA